MNLVLDGRSAFEFWMSAAGSVAMHVVHTNNTGLTAFEGTTCSALAQSISKTDGAPHELDLLVREASDRRRAKGIRCHNWKKNCPIPEGSIIEIGPSLQTISPELCAIRLAVTMPRLEYLRALTDLLSIFSLATVDRTNLIHRDPIMTKASLLCYLDKCGPLPGSAIARQALNWVVEQTASPRETSMALALALPTKLGGQGMPPFEANRHYDLEEYAKTLTQKSYLVADVAWHERKRILEYNSDKYHDSEQQKEFDFEKITTFQRMQKTVTPVSTRQFNDYDAFFSIVEGLREDFGIRDRHTERADDQRRRTHAALLATERQQREQPSLIDLTTWRYLLPRIDLDSCE